MTSYRLHAPFGILTLLAFLHAPGFSEDRNLSSILERAEQDSRVMDHAFFLSDVYGPRFLGSPASYQAAEWVKKRLEEIGVTNARSEGIGPVEEPGFHWSGRGWSYTRFSFHLLEPQYANLTAIPVPFSPATAGIVSGLPIRVDL